MRKTHEKSRIVVMDAEEIRLTSRIVIQVQQIDGSQRPRFLCETVDPENYDRTAAEGRASEAEKCLQDEIEAHRIEMEEAEAKIEALEELLAQARDERDAAREDAERQRQENAPLNNTFPDAKSIFGEDCVKYMGKALIEIPVEYENGEKEGVFLEAYTEWRDRENNKVVGIECPKILKFSLLER